MPDVYAALWDMDGTLVDTAELHFRAWQEVCRELARGTPTQEFREASLVDFLREMATHVASRGGKNTICLLPLTEGSHGIKDWDAVAALRGLDVFATDPYWKNFGETADSFVGRFAKLLAESGLLLSYGLVIRRSQPPSPAGSLSAGSSLRIAS